MDSREPQWAAGVRERIYEHVYSHLDQEVGGVLVGGLDESGRLAVNGAIAALEAEGARSRVTFTHDAWAAVHRTLEEDFPGQTIVGWYHSHPGFGIFLSKHDLFIHEYFFSSPHQIALVVDPHASTEGTFGWVDGEVRSLNGRPAPRPGGARDYSHRALVALAGFGAVLGAIVWLAFLGGGGPADRAPIPDRPPQPVPVVPVPEEPPEAQPPEAQPPEAQPPEEDDEGTPPHAPRPPLPLSPDRLAPTRASTVVLG